MPSETAGAGEPLRYYASARRDRDPVRSSRGEPTSPISMAKAPGPIGSAAPAARVVALDTSTRMLRIARAQRSPCRSLTGR